MNENLTKKLSNLKARLLKKQKNKHKNRFTPINKDAKPEVKYGKRGGRYTEDKTKDGRPYRRYF